jgi:hypothetical protein
MLVYIIICHTSSSIALVKEVAVASTKPRNNKNISLLTPLVLLLEHDMQVSFLYTVSFFYNTGVLYNLLDVTSGVRVKESVLWYSSIVIYSHQAVAHKNETLYNML